MFRSGVGKTSVRYITIQQPSSANTTQPVTLAVDKSEVTPIIDSSSVENIESPTFKTIGSPASSLSITTPPSVPVHVKKGSVISVYSYGQKETGTGNNNFVKSTWEFAKPLRRLLLTGDSSTYQRIIGTVPLQLLVSAYDSVSSKSASVKSFVNLSLNGSYDWILFKPSSLQVYTGNSLNISVKSLPKRLHNGFKNRGYTLLNGRGLASVVGRGSVFKVGLSIGEEIRVNRNNLFAISVREESEMNGNSAVINEAWNSMNGLFHETEKYKQVENKPKKLVLFNNPSIDTVISKAYKYTKKIFAFAQTTKLYITDYMIGNGNYVLVKGPRTVLIETGSSNDRFVVNTFQRIEGVEKLEKFITKEEEWRKPKADVGDNLGIVSIQNGKASYKNVANFSDEVKRIESLTK